ncbi:hypothetical protein BEL04_21585 [Mucilaginibacter sp. PPCGB 2223]|uniref:hypothetical protein n=1 Tax=Mucilaginibacter sp. PPCGB 2223 TaxID=1886027 RepID=UPI000824C5E4|nr:hypothetical protein [Mucilaginibacter sp. PPCGB 2223]OCX50380.1 hypothetical protein BEL04_21585 [Mucilaginibacter sp. PPCGB 2223]
MKPLAIAFALFCFYTTVYAQKVGDTIYYDANWKKIKNRDNAWYFRSIDKTAGGLFYVTDHYSNGNPQMSGAYSFARPEIKNGEFTFYNSQG